MQGDGGRALSQQGSVSRDAFQGGFNGFHDFVLHWYILKMTGFDVNAPMVFSLIVHFSNNIHNAASHHTTACHVRIHHQRLRGATNETVKRLIQVHKLPRAKGGEGNEFGIDFHVRFRDDLPFVFMTLRHWIHLAEDLQMGAEAETPIPVFDKPSHTLGKFCIDCKTNMGRFVVVAFVSQLRHFQSHGGPLVLSNGILAVFKKIIFPRFGVQGNALNDLIQEKCHQLRSSSNDII